LKKKLYLILVSTSLVFTSFILVGGNLQNSLIRDNGKPAYVERDAIVPDAPKPTFVQREAIVPDSEKV
jgi:hypothetical protein